MFVGSNFDWFIKTFLLAMVGVTERAIELPFNDKLLALSFDHEGFHALTTSSLITTLQNNGFPVLKIKRKFAELTFKERGLDR